MLAESLVEARPQGRRTMGAALDMNEHVFNQTIEDETADTYLLELQHYKSSILIEHKNWRLQLAKLPDTRTTTVSFPDKVAQRRAAHIGISKNIDLSR